MKFTGSSVLIYDPLVLVATKYYERRLGLRSRFPSDAELDGEARRAESEHGWQ